MEIRQLFTTPRFIYANLSSSYISCITWGQHGAHLGPIDPRWAPCWPHEPCHKAYRWNHVCLAAHVASSMQAKINQVKWMASQIATRLIVQLLYINSKLLGYKLLPLFVRVIPGHQWIPLIKVTNTESIPMFWRHHTHDWPTIRGHW